MGYEYISVSWKGIGGKLVLETIAKKQVYNKKAYLEDVVCVLDQLSTDGGWILRSGMNLKGKTVWTLCRKKEKMKNQSYKSCKYQKHLIIYWGGKNQRIESVPQIVDSNINASTYKDILKILEAVSKKRHGKWIVTATSSSKQATIWTLVSCVNHIQ